MDVWKRPGIWVGLTLWLLAAVIWVVGSRRTPHAIAQPIPVPAATTNTYWAGYVATTDGSYSSVQASWAVPRIACPRQGGRNATAYVWVGEGGYVRGISSPLIQAGTASDCFSGVTRYHAFYEWYPGIYATDFPMTVQPGDRVTVRVEETQPDYWVLTAHDDTSDASAATATYFQADTGSADLIVERPTVCSSWYCSQVALPRFDSVTFDHVTTHTAAGTSGDLGQSVLPIALVDPVTGASLAVPGRVVAEHDALSVLWRQSL